MISSSVTQGKRHESSLFFAKTTETLIVAAKSIPSSLPQYCELINRRVRISSLKKKKNKKLNSRKQEDTLKSKEKNSKID